jgi:uncharacterized iron-regulated membrane protein
MRGELLMISRMVRSGLAWLTFAGLVMGITMLPNQARAAQPAGSTGAQKTAAASKSSGKAGSSHKGMVWVNPKTKVFHRPGDQWYGKSKGGKYMTEADAVKAGYRPAKPRHQLSNAKKKKPSK